MTKRIYIQIIVLFALFTTVFAQDSTFTIEESFRFGYHYTCLTKADANNDGIHELYGAHYYSVDDNTHHRIDVIEGNEVSYQTELIPNHVKGIFIYDFNRDNVNDVVVRNYTGELEVYYGPDYDTDLIERNYYLGNVKHGFDRLLPDGETHPNVLITKSSVHDYNDSSFAVCYKYCNSCEPVGTRMQKLNLTSVIPAKAGILYFLINNN